MAPAVTLDEAEPTLYLVEYLVPPLANQHDDRRSWTGEVEYRLALSGGVDGSLV